MSAHQRIAIKLPEPHPGQVRVLDERARFNVLECGRRFGKSALGEHVAIEGMLQGQRVGWFAPTHKILDEARREITSLMEPVTAYANKVEARIELITGGTLEFWSLDNPDSGRSRKYHRIIIDEAGIIRDLEQAWNETLRATLADYRGEAWFLGTPKGRNFFHRLFAKGESGEQNWRSWRLPTTANPYIDPEEIEEARRSMPESAFNQEFLGIPADDGGNPFGLDAIRDCFAERIEGGRPIAWAWDLAKSYDWTWGGAIDADGNIVRSERWQAPWETTISRIASMTDAPALVDSTGVGDPVLESLQKHDRRKFEGFKFSSTSKQQIMEGLAVALQRREIRFADPVLRSELESFEYEYTRTGVRYEAPQGMHDDGVCMLAMLVHQRNRARVPGDLGLTI